MNSTPTYGKPINTCLSAGTDIESEEIQKAKKYLTDNFNNHYNLLPHITFTICPFPEDNLAKIVKEIDSYFEGKNRISFELAPLNYEPQKQFFSLPIVGSEIKKIHEDLVNLFNKYRDGYIREKDLLRFQSNERTVKDMELIQQYGYFRIFERFTPHITIGNVETTDEMMPLIKNELERLLENTISKNITVNKIHLTFHTDSEIQSDMQEIWGKDYFLK